MTPKAMRLKGHGLTPDGHSCKCGKTVDNMQDFSKHCANVQRRVEQPMDVHHTMKRYRLP